MSKIPGPGHNAKQIDSIQWIILAMEDVTARKGLEVKVAEYAKGLEVKVAERTQELGARVRDLEKLNKSMVGRELKMVELKDEIKGLEQRGTRKDENDCLTKT